MTIGVEECSLPRAPERLGQQGIEHQCGRRGRGCRAPFLIFTPSMRSIAVMRAVQNGNSSGTRTFG